LTSASKSLSPLHFRVKKSGEQPHAALAYAPGVEVPRQIEAEREAVPVAGGAGI